MKRQMKWEDCWVENSYVYKDGSPYTSGSDKESHVAQRLNSLERESIL